MNQTLQLIKSLWRGLWPLLSIIFIILISAELYWQYELRHPSTRDAVLYNGLTPISTQVDGRITQIAVKPDQAVQKGQLLFSLDDSQAKINLQTAELNLTLAQQNLKQLAAQLIEATQKVKQTAADLEITQKEYARYTKLYNQKAISNSDYESKQSALLMAQSNYKDALANKTIIQAKIGEKGKNAAIAQAQLNIHNAILALNDHYIHAPISGHLGNFNLAVGQLVSANTVLFGILPNDGWGIHANILEPFMRNIKVGQPVSFTTSMYPGHHYHGIVSGIGYGVQIDGWQASAAVPNIDPSFNWLTVTKRFPILIKVTSKDNPYLRFGASVNVTIDASH